MTQLLDYLDAVSLQEAKVEFDLALARGLNYYTGTIFETISTDVKIGTIASGGRYDNLTDIFGLSGVSGVGISFGLDRIYDVMQELDAFKKLDLNTSKILLIPFDEGAEKWALKCLQTLRQRNIRSEIYPDTNAKLKKKMKYANAKNIPFIGLIGSQEVEAEKLGLKNMESGEQTPETLEDVVKKLSI
jgi:histidyl-tRNA synthetase